MWKKTFDYKGESTRKDYWLAIIMNVIVMYVGVIPYTLLAMGITKNALLLTIPYIIIFHLPILALYVRRTNNLQLKRSTKLFITMVIPMVSGLLVGIISTTFAKKDLPRYYYIARILFGLSIGLGLYGIHLGKIVWDNPIVFSVLYYPGLFIGVVALVYFGYNECKRML